MCGYNAVDEGVCCLVSPKCRVGQESMQQEVVRWLDAINHQSVGHDLAELQKLSVLEDLTVSEQLSVAAIVNGTDQRVCMHRRCVMSQTD